MKLTNSSKTDKGKKKEKTVIVNISNKTRAIITDLADTKNKGILQTLKKVMVQFLKKHKLAQLMSTNTSE